MFHYQIFAAVDRSRLLVRRAIVFAANPKRVGLRALGVPTQRQIREILKAGVFVDWMAETGDDRFITTGHAGTKELPSPIFDVVRNVRDRFGIGLNRLRQED
jgi:hypothetical protein